MFLIKEKLNLEDFKIRGLEVNFEADSGQCEAWVEVFNLIDFIYLLNIYLISFKEVLFVKTFKYFFKMFSGDHIIINHV